MGFKDIEILNKSLCQRLTQLLSEEMLDPYRVYTTTTGNQSGNKESRKPTKDSQYNSSDFRTHRTQFSQVKYLEGKYFKYS